MSRYALTLALAAALSLPVGADFNSAVAAYGNKQFEAAYNEFRRLAELGDGPSQRNLAAMYARGEHVNKDLAEALAWAELATENDPDGSRDLRDAIASKLAGADRERASARLLELQSVYGNAALDARLMPVPSEQLADCTVDVVSYSKPAKTTPPRYPMSAARDGIEASICASFYIKEDGTPTRLRIYSSQAYLKGNRGAARSASSFEQEALRAFAKWYFVPPASAALRELQGRYCMDFKLEDDPYGHRKAEKAALNERIDAATRGDASAQYLLAEQVESKLQSYKFSDDKRQSLTETARQLYQQSARGGNPAGQFRLAKDLLTGNRCEKDVEKGLFWLTIAAQQGHTESQYLLGSRLLHGEGVEKSIAKAGIWLESAAKADHPRAKTDYALFLLRHQPERAGEAKAYLPEQADDNDMLQLEAIALSSAMAGDFELATRYQAMALNIAQDVGLRADERAAVLARYQASLLPEHSASL